MSVSQTEPLARPRRSRLAIAAVALLLLGTSVVLAGSARLDARLTATYDPVVQELPLPTDAASLARGEHLARSVALCTDCHGADLSGRTIVQDPLAGHLVAPNITPGQGSVVVDHTDTDWFRAVRHGVGRDGLPLQFMPSHEFARYSLEDTAAIIAWVKSAPPVDVEQPELRLGPVMKVVVLTDQNPSALPAEHIDHDAPPPPHLEPTVSVAYGERMAVACTGCHGPEFSGGAIPGVPPTFPAAANLTPHATGLGGWSYSEFQIVMRTGARPDGTEVDPFMPWPAYSQMTDTELGALWAYLQAQPAKEVGGR